MRIAECPRSSVHACCRRLPLSRKGLGEIAKKLAWQTTRMNLNTSPGTACLKRAVVKPDCGAFARFVRIRRARVFPYQLMTAHQNCDEAVRRRCGTLCRTRWSGDRQRAVDRRPDRGLSGRLGFDDGPGYGSPSGATTKVRCVDVAALVAASVLRKDPIGDVLPFEQSSWAAGSELARQRDDERRTPGLDRWWRHQLQCARSDSA